ncbi:MAG: Rieske (2Fe-2S) protein [Geodermatophilaceae bacterium]|nr:Rieske (2Fe-2S) protein [Geodermatophilaceae bacterium]
MWPFHLIDRLENASALDAVAARIKPVVEKATSNRTVTDALHGVWLGHPLHPVLVQVPVGAWTSAAVLDAVPAMRPAAGLLIGVGIAGAAPAIASGWTDWSQQDTQQQRTGVVHAIGNTIALTLYAGSLYARRRNRVGVGAALAYTGYAVAAASATIGGHLAYRQAAGPSHAVPHAEIAPADWTDIGALSDLPDGTPGSARLGEVDLLVVRRGQQVDVLVDRCSHASAPLHEGELVTERGRLCIACPWHGSVFDVQTGRAVHGPATAPQPALDVRVEDGRVRVRLPGLSLG